MPRETTVLAPSLAPGDRIVSTGFAGILGLVTAVRVLPSVVGVTLADGSTHALPPYEVCRVERELPTFAEAAHA